MELDQRRGRGSQGPSMGNQGPGGGFQQRENIREDSMLAQLWGSRAGADPGPELTLSIPCSFLTFRASSFARKSANPWGGLTRGTRSLTGVTAGHSTRVSPSSGWSRLTTSEKYRASSRTCIGGGGA